MNIKYIEGDEDLPSGYYCKVGNVFYLIEDLINNKDKEIERLNKELDKTRLSELNKEYIIYELERILQLEVLKTRENNEYNKGLTNAFNYVIHMISELKGSDK